MPRIVRNPNSSWPEDICPRTIYEPGEAYVLYSEHTSDDQVRWGGCDDPRAFLIPGRVYELAREDVHSGHMKMALRGIESGRVFNSVSFERVNKDTESGLLG